MARNDIIEIDATKLKRMQSLHVNFLLFDLRSLEEYQAGHIPNAFHVAKENFLKKLVEEVGKKDAAIVIYDATGIQSGNLVLEAEKLGFTNIVNLDGGFEAYQRA